MIVLTTAPFLYGQIPVFVDVNVFTGQEILVSLSDVMLTTWGVHFFCHFCFLCYTDHAIRTTLLKNRQHFDIEEYSGLGHCYKWFQLAVFPFADFFLFVIPTIHAHTKLFLSSTFNYVPSAKMGA